MNKFFFLIVLIALLAACEDPIDVDLIDAESQVAVDAWLTNESAPQFIKMTYSQGYLDSSPAEPITDAEVTVSNANGQNYVFGHEGEGSYVWTPQPGEQIGTIGDQFELTINHDGQTYTAVSMMNEAPKIDSIFQEFRDDDVFLEDGIYCQFFARDLEGMGDSYWIKTFKNDTFLNRATEFNIAFDAGFDTGSVVDGIIFITPIRDLANPTDENGIPQPWHSGDKIRVEIHAITNASFDYLEILRDQLLNSFNGIFAEPLANPVGNIESTGEAKVLGQFNVAAVSSIEEIIR